MSTEKEDFPMMFQEMDDLRGHQENTASWQRRRRFLQIHWGRYPIEKLNLLSYCYANILMYGCDYSKTVMKELSPLAVDVAVATALDSGDVKVVISQNYLRDMQEHKKCQLHEEFNIIKAVQQLRSEKKKLESKPEELFEEIETLSSEKENDFQPSIDIAHRSTDKKTKATDRCLEDKVNAGESSNDYPSISIPVLPMTAEQWLLSKFLGRGQKSDCENHQRHFPSVERHDTGNCVQTTAGWNDHTLIKVRSSRNTLHESHRSLVTNENSEPNICQYHGSSVIDGRIPDGKYYMKGKRVYHKPTTCVGAETSMEGSISNSLNDTERMERRQCSNKDEEKISRTEISKEGETTLKRNSGKFHAEDTVEWIQETFSPSGNIHLHESKPEQYIECRERDDKKATTRSKHQTMYVSKAYRNSLQKKMLWSKVKQAHARGHRMVKTANRCVYQVDKQQHLALGKVHQSSEHHSSVDDQYGHVKLPYKQEKGHLQKLSGMDLTPKRVCNTTEAGSQATSSQINVPDVECRPSAVIQRRPNRESIHRAQKAYIQLQKKKIRSGINETSDNTDKGQTKDEDGTKKINNKSGNCSLEDENEEEILITGVPNRESGNRDIKLGHKRKDIALYSEKLIKKYSVKRESLSRAEDRLLQKISMGKGVPVSKSVPREVTCSRDTNVTVVDPEDNIFCLASVGKGEFVVPNVKHQRKMDSYASSKEKKIYQGQQDYAKWLSSVVSARDSRMDQTAEALISMSAAKNDKMTKKSKAFTLEDNVENLSSMKNAAYKVSYGGNVDPMNVYKAELQTKAMEQQRSS